MLARRSGSFAGAFARAFARAFAGAFAGALAGALAGAFAGAFAAFAAFAGAFAGRNRDRRHRCETNRKTTGSKVRKRLSGDGKLLLPLLIRNILGRVRVSSAAPLQIKDGKGLHHLFVPRTNRHRHHAKDHNKDPGNHEE